jgi:hypothetical protein
MNVSILVGSEQRSPPKRKRPSFNASRVRLSRSKFSGAPNRLRYSASKAFRLLSTKRYSTRRPISADDRGHLRHREILRTDLPDNSALACGLGQFLYRKISDGISGQAKQMPVDSRAVGNTKRNFAERDAQHLVPKPRDNRLLAAPLSVGPRAVQECRKPDRPLA